MPVTQHSCGLLEEGEEAVPLEISGDKCLGCGAVGLWSEL